jgi:hypothetical protein
VGDWYRVTKKIHGRLYHYWQRTTRVGKSVKTENKYIGPAEGRPALGPSTFSASAPMLPEDVMGQYFSPKTSDNRKSGNIAKLNREKKRILRNEEFFDEGAFNHIQDQLDYAYSVKRTTQKIREAKRKTKGIKSANPFLAQALIKRP